MKTALILTTYNRPEYLKRCLDSLSRATPPDVLIIVDDASTDENTMHLLYYFEPDVVWVKHRKQKNKGIKDSLLIGFEEAFNVYNCDVAINLDADAITRPDFIKRLTDLYDGRHIVSGFNCNNPKNPILSEHDGYVMRQHGNGINMLVDKNQYETILKPALQRDGNWDYNSTNQTPFKITKPSVVQHIGLKSSMGHNNNPDVACDFVQLSLPTVTLFGIDAHDPKGIQRAAEICTRGIEFGAVKIITERLFFGREGYSKFCIQDMNSYIDTEHVLIIHPDGYIQDPSAWRDEWLQYDYIGASWWFKDGYNVGNGGFSLRSKKLLEILANTDMTDIGFHPEDEKIARVLRRWLEEDHGIKFAPTDVADRFSIEAYNVPPPDNVYSGQFGFHGHHVRGLPVPMEPKPQPVKSKLRR